MGSMDCAARGEELLSDLWIDECPGPRIAWHIDHVGSFSAVQIIATSAGTIIEQGQCRVALTLDQARELAHDLADVIRMLERG